MRKLTDWLKEHKMCFIDHYKQNVILWDIWYSDYKTKEVLILLIKKCYIWMDIIEKDNEKLPNIFPLSISVSTAAELSVMKWKTKFGWV